jgi:hypothetical protein
MFSFVVNGPQRLIDQAVNDAEKVKQWTWFLMRMQVPASAVIPIVTVSFPGAGLLSVALPPFVSLLLLGLFPLLSGVLPTPLPHAAIDINRMQISSNARGFRIATFFVFIFSSNNKNLVSGLLSSSL